jgi:hypothetical protein
MSIENTFSSDEYLRPRLNTVFAHSGEWAMHMQGWTEAPAQSSPANPNGKEYNVMVLFQK